jgi:uncharacterized SAM-binding protein YcdF (DUF218 family)
MTEQFTRRRKWRWPLFASGLIVAALLIAGAYAFLHAGSWLVREDALQKSQAIVVLSGGLPDRALAAAKVYRDGFAPEVWLTQPVQPAAAMAELRLPYAGEEEYSRMVLIEQGVPQRAIRTLQPRILNTADELKAVAETLDQSSGKNSPATAIIVTSKAHTRRVRSIWNKVSAGHRARLLIRAAPEDSFDPEHWWRTTNDALSVVREYLGLLNAWAGLPLAHSK